MLVQRSFSSLLPCNDDAVSQKRMAVLYDFSLPNSQQEPKEQEVQDRRRIPRVSVNLRVTYRDGHLSKTATCLNLSLGGLFLQMPKNQVESLGEIIELSFLLPTAESLSERVVIHAFARIVRRVPGGCPISGELPGVGVEFVGGLDAALDLKKFLDSKLGFSSPVPILPWLEETFAKPSWATRLPLLPVQLIEERKRQWAMLKASMGCY